MRSIYTANTDSFGDYYKNAISSIEQTLNTTVDASVSNLSSLGIGIGLAFLGSWIVKRNRSSKLARSLARLFGVDVNKFDKQYVLENLSDKDFFENIGAKVLQVCQDGNISEFSKFLEISENESWEIYLQIKDVILDDAILKSIANNTKISEQIEKSLKDSKLIASKIESEVRNFKQEIDSLREKIISLTLSGMGIQFFSPFDEFGDAHPDCWKDGYFSDEDIFNDYSAKREVTEEIQNSINDTKSIGAVVSASSGNGKTMILKQIMFDELKKGVTVIFSKNSKAPSPLLLEFLKEASKKNKILVIADDIQDKGNESFFESVNRFSSNDNIRFLFAFRPQEFRNLLRSLTRDSVQEVTRAMNSLTKFELKFDEFDARSFLEKSLESSNIPIPDDEDLDEISQELYAKYPEPLMFSIGLQQEILQNKDPVHDILNADFIDKYDDNISNDESLRKSAILCSCLNSLGIPISPSLLEKCKIRKDQTDILTKKHFLLETSDGTFTQRHELWSFQFLLYVVENLCNKNLELFEKYSHLTQNLNHIVTDLSPQEVFSIINRLVIFAQNENLLKLSQHILENLEIPDTFSDNHKAEMYAYGLGQFYFQKEDHKKSIFYNKKALELDSSMIVIHHNLGVSLSKMGKTTEALQEFDEAIFLNKEFLISYFAKGTLLCEMGNLEEGSKIFAKAAKIPVENYDYVLQQELSKKLKRFDMHISETSELAKSDYQKLLNNQRIALAKLGKYKDAILCCDDLLKINPKNIDAIFAKASYFGKLGSFQKSLPLYDEILKIEPENYEALCNKATALSELEHLEESLPFFKQALDKRPDDIEMIYNYAVLLQKLGDSNEATQLIEKVISVKPDHYDSLYLKGIILETHQNFVDAIHYFDKVLKIKHDHFPALNNSAACFAELDLLDDALSRIELALDINPNHLSSLANKAAILGRIGRTQESLDVCNKILRIAPQSLDVMQNKATSLRQLGESERALRIYTNILKIKPDYLNALYDKGTLLLELEKLSRSRKEFQKIIAIDENHLGALNCLGIISSKSKNYSQAMGYFEKVLSQDPENFGAQMNLETAMAHLKENNSKK